MVGLLLKCMKIRKSIINHWFLIISIGLAVILRLWKLESIPPHLTPDEASLGYNAYSILKTGKDEYGEFLPIVFKSFGDYKPGLYVYLTVPFVAILGLTEFAVRLPSALAGVVTVYLIYLIVKELFSDSTLNSKLKIENWAALVAAFNPWLLYFSRGAWEVNLSLTLTLIGLYFFLKGIRSGKYIVHSSIFFALTLLSYQGAKLSSGIVVLILLLVSWKEFGKIKKKYLGLGFISGLIISLPIIASLFQGKAGRLNVFSVFSYRRPTENLQIFLDQGREKIGSLSYYLFHSEGLNFARGILGRYFNHFSGRFLFFEGDWGNPRHSAPYQGVFLLSDPILLVTGLFFILKSSGIKDKAKAFLFLWLALAPLPAVLSRDQVHAVRSLNMAVPLIIILAFGLTEILKYKKLLILIVGFYFLALSYFFDAYFVHLPKHNSADWKYGYKQIVETVTPIQPNYQKIKVQQSFDQPYIYFLFYQKYDPAKYQKQANWIESEYKDDVGYVTKLDNIEFTPIDWPVNQNEHGTLFVIDSIKLSPENLRERALFKIVKEIKYLNNRDIAFRIIEVK